MKRRGTCSLFHFILLTEVVSLEQIPKTIFIFYFKKKETRKKNWDWNHEFVDPFFNSCRELILPLVTPRLFIKSFAWVQMRGQPTFVPGYLTCLKNRSNLVTSHFPVPSVPDQQTSQIASVNPFSISSSRISQEFSYREQEKKKKNQLVHSISSFQN